MKEEYYPNGCCAVNPFERRGGYSYAKTALKFKWTQFRKGHMSFADFFISGIGQFVVSCLPNEVRKIFYMKVLRG